MLSKKYRSVVALGTLASILAGAACGSSRRQAPEHRVKAAPAPRILDAPVGARPKPRDPPAPLSVAGLLGRLPARARWVVALGSVGRLVARAASVLGLLAIVPALRPAADEVRRALKTLFGAWPPASATWTGLGLAPRGAVVVAGVPGAADRGGPGSPDVVVLVHARRPRRAAEALARWGRRARFGTRISLFGSRTLQCEAGRLVVRCATRTALLAELRSAASPAWIDHPGLAPLSAGLRGRAPLSAVWRGADGQVAWGFAGALDPAGVRGRLLVGGAWGKRLSGWFGAPATAPPAGARVVPAGRGAIAWARAQLSRTAMRALVARLPPWLVPLPHRAQRRAANLAALLASATGRLWWRLDGGGWTVVVETGGPADPLAPDRPQRSISILFPELWVHTPRGRVVLSSSAAGAHAGAEWGVAAPAVVPRGPRPAAGAPPPAALSLRLPLVDPWDLLADVDRRRLVDIAVGLTETERRTVAVGRALLALAGELRLRATPAGGALVVDLELRSPAGGAPAATQRFRRLWATKWRRRGGTFAPGALADAAKGLPGGPVVGRIAAWLAALRPVGPVSALLTQQLTRVIDEITGPVVPCRRLAERSNRCLRNFGRLFDPERWRRYPPKLPRWMRQQPAFVALMRRAAAQVGAITARCDQALGRLPQAARLNRCLRFRTCYSLSRCVVAALRPAPR